MPPCLHEIAQNSIFSQLPARFQAVQPFHQDETFAIPSHQNRYLLSDLQNALGDLLRLFRIKRCSTFGRDVDVCDCKFLALHHCFYDAWSKPDKSGLGCRGLVQTE
jgi:hypothetical protein